jgi:crotonobetainyl-CoA:carnitine CoA-transferase CaiB-like acyl-CoA transferase
MPAPVPVFSRTPGRVGSTSPEPGQHTDQVLIEVGYDRDDIDRLRSAGIVD